MCFVTYQQNLQRTSYFSQSTVECGLSCSMIKCNFLYDQCLNELKIRKNVIFDLNQSQWRFHEEFHNIKYYHVDAVMRENEKVS
jgi:hypothetical protein